MTQRLVTFAALLWLACAAWIYAAPVTPPYVTVPQPDGSQVRYVPETQPVQPTTVPATQPVLLPGLVRKVAGADPRGDGYRVPANIALVENLWVDGFEQNIVIENHPLPTLVQNVYSLNSHRPAGAFTQKGQTFYFDKCGPLTLREVYSELAGWQPGQPPQHRDTWRHSIYANFGVEDLTVEDAWLDAPACAAIQSRGKIATVRRCLITRAGIAILSLGRVRIENSTVYAGRVYYNPPTEEPKRPASWSGNVGVMAYHPVELSDVWFVGSPHQGNDVTAIPGLKTWHLGCIVTGGNHPKPEWSPPKGPDGKRITKLVTATNCRIIGWPGAPFAGASPHDGSGFTVGGDPVNVWDELEAIRADLKAQRISMKDAVAKGQAAVRGTR